jgi:hypothetical protein
VAHRTTQIILHIGAGKCGSTSIQAALADARNALLSDGILYDPIGRGSGHFAYAALMGFTTRGGVEQDKSAALHNIHSISAFVANNPVKFLLFSAESFFRRGPASIIEVLQKLDVRIEGIHIIAYVRNHADLYLSLVQQQLKASHTFCLPENFALHAARTLRRWQSNHLCRSVNLRIFDAKTLRNGSVVADFEEVLRGITGVEGIVLQDVRENESISAEQMIAMQDFRRDFLGGIPNRFHPYSTRTVLLFSRLNLCYGLVKTKPQLSALARALVMRTNMQDILMLEKMFPSIKIERQAMLLPTDLERSRAEWKSGNVRSILEFHKPEVVHALKMLLPWYNNGLPLGNVDSALTSLATFGNPPAFIEQYCSFLETNGCTEAAQTLRRGAAPAEARDDVRGGGYESGSERTEWPRRVRSWVAKLWR